jgi:hypothetical protein
VNLEMLGERIDPLRQYRNLNVGGTRIALMSLELIHNLFLFLYA